MSDSKEEPQPLSNDDIPAAFWDTLAEDEENPDLLAIKALQEESTPEERAQTLKEQGNDLFKRGLQLNKKYFVQQAIVKYTEGLKIDRLPQGATKSMLHGNRAQAHLRILNNRSALEDAVTALSIDSSNVKAAFRGATAAERLGDFVKAADICRQGLEAEPTSSELQKLSKELQGRAEAAAKAKHQEEAKRLVARAPSKRLAMALLKQGWQIGAPQVTIGSRKPYVGEAGVIHWPLIFVYPETMQNDIVEDAAETDTLKAHLDVMFDPSAEPLAWDSGNAYTRDRLEVYYMSYAATPLPLDKLTEALHTGWPEGFDDRGPQRYGDQASRPVRIKDHLSIGEVLQRRDYVVPGIPVFFLLSRGTSFRDKFLESA